MPTTSQIVGATALPVDDAHRSFVLKSPVISFIGKTAADVIKSIPVKAGMVIDLVTSVIVEVNNVGSAAFGVGDGDATSGYDAAVSATAAIGTRAESAKGTDTFALAGKAYAADDTIDIILTTQGSIPTAGKVQLYAHGYWA